MQAVEYLHNINVIHRDLKPLNILLTDQCRCPKVCDFGTVREKATTMTGKRGTPAYMAPEVIIILFFFYVTHICFMLLIRISSPQVYGGNKYTEKCDVFSWGLSMFEILSRKIPYEHIQNELKICEHVKNG